MLELIWRTPKPADRLEDGCLLTWLTSVDQCQPVVALDQEGVCHPHRDDVNAFDHTLHRHRQDPSRESTLTDRMEIVGGRWPDLECILWTVCLLPPQAVAMGTDEVVFHSARNLFMLECYCESDD